VHPGTPEADAIAAHVGKPLAREYRLYELLKRPELDHATLSRVCELPSVSDQVSEQVEIAAKYAGYIDRQHEEVDRLKRYENTSLGSDFDYVNVDGLSNEVRHKLTAVRPATLAQAGRIPGVTPAAISLLLVHLKKLGRLERRSA